MPKTDLIEFNGKITAALGGGQYMVEVISSEKKVDIRAQLSGKLHQHHIRVLPGDEVVVSVSPYDLTHGLITYRGRKRLSDVGPSNQSM